MLSASILQISTLSFSVERERARERERVCACARERERQRDRDGERERERERESEENERRKRDRESLMRSVTELWYHHCMSSRIRTVTVADWLELTCTHSSRVYARTHADVKDLTRAYEKSGRQDLISEVQLRACIGARPRESGALASADYRRESDRRESS